MISPARNLHLWLGFSMVMLNNQMVFPIKKNMFLEIDGNISGNHLELQPRATNLSTALSRNGGRRLRPHRPHRYYGSNPFLGMESKQEECGLHKCFKMGVPSGKRLHNYGKLPFIVDFPIENGGSFHSYVNVYQRVSHFFN